MIESIKEVAKRRIRRNSVMWSLLKKEFGLYRNINKIFNNKKWKKKSHEYFTYLSKKANENNFFFIQIGANDGSMADPINKLILKYGWKGILIEPQKLEFAKLKNTYKNCQNLIFVRAAISRDEGYKTLYKIKYNKIQHFWEKGMATLCPEKIFSNYKKTDLETEKVTCISFMNLIKKYNINGVDLLQIDVEGYDYEIIKLIDFNIIKPLIIHYEHVYLTSREQKRCAKYLRNHGYKIYEEQNDTGAILDENYCNTLKK